MSGNGNGTDIRPGGGRYFFRGLAYSLVGLLIVVPVQLFLYRLWIESLKVEPDFLDTGLNYLTIAMYTMVPLMDAAVFVVAFVLFLPAVYGGRRKSGAGPAPVLPIVGGYAVLVAGLFAYFTGIGGTHLLFPLTAGPPVAYVIFGMRRFLLRANTDLRQPAERPH